MLVCCIHPGNTAATWVVFFLHLTTHFLDVCLSFSRSFTFARPLTCQAPSTGIADRQTDQIAVGTKECLSLSMGQGRQRSHPLWALFWPTRKEEKRGVVVASSLLHCAFYIRKRHPASSTTELDFFTSLSNILTSFSVAQPKHTSM